MKKLNYNSFIMTQNDLIRELKRLTQLKLDLEIMENDFEDLSVKYIKQYMDLIFIKDCETKMILKSTMLHHLGKRRWRLINGCLLKKKVFSHIDMFTLEYNI